MPSVIINTTHYNVELCYCFYRLCAETYKCSFFVVAKKLVPNESFTKCVKLPYRHVAPSWHYLHHKASTYWESVICLFWLYIACHMYCVSENPGPLCYFCHIYLLGKGGYVFGSVGLFVCLSVCLSVDNITQKVMNGLGWNFMEGSWIVQWRTD